MSKVHNGARYDVMTTCYTGERRNESVLKISILAASVFDEAEITITVALFIRFIGY